MEKDINNTRIRIKELLAHEGVTVTELLNEWNKVFPDKKTSIQNFSNKVSKGTIRFEEVEKLVGLLGYRIEFVKDEDVNKTKKAGF